MKFTLPWLKEHLETDADAATIGDKLTAIGFEVEGIEPRGADLDGFSVGHVTGVRQHPNADRLSLCTVATKTGAYEVVCGAPNVRLGMKGIFAPEGSVIPATGTVLKRSTIRGVESKGMLCSARELGIGEDHDGIIDLGDEPTVGTPAADALGLEGPVYDVAVTPNRGDGFGIHGLARELAAAGVGTLIQPDTRPVEAAFETSRSVDLRFPHEAREACPLFVLRELRDVQNGPSPAWLQERLKAVGLRPITALVDITNWSTLDMCRPLHVFDADKVHGDLYLRLAEAGESFVGLDDKTYVLDAGMVVICDDTGIVSLAGIMGGASTGCDEQTTNVLLEMALFDPVRTARTGRRLGIESDARQRFERGVDPAFVLPAADYATRMIQALCGGEAGSVVVAGSVPENRKLIALNRGELTRLTGLVADDAEILRILWDLGFDAAAESEGRFGVTTPSWRHDCARAADLVEELARIKGFDAIPATPIRRERAVGRPVLDGSQLRRLRLRRALAARGLEETVTFSFISEAEAAAFGGAKIRVANPISADLVAMRPSLLPSLAAGVARNQARAVNDVGLFELAAIFSATEPGGQEWVTAGVRAGSASPRSWGEPDRPTDALDAKADALAALAASGVNLASLRLEPTGPEHFHPGRSGIFKIGRETVATFGELHPGLAKLFDWTTRVLGFEVFVDRLPPLKPAKTRARPPLKASAYQPVDRDFAFLVDATAPAGDLLAAIGKASELISDVTLFDDYAGKGVPEGKRSLAIAVRMQALDRTLSDADIQQVATRVIEAARQACGAELR